MSQDENTPLDPSPEETPEASEGNASAETENTAPENAKENMVPQSRFSEVIAERNEYRDSLAAMQEKIAALEARSAPPNEDEDSTVVEARKLIRETVERQLGMSLEEAKQSLAEAKQAKKTAGELKWERACQKAGLDPTNHDVMTVALGYGNANPNATPAEIVDYVSGILGPKTATQDTRPKARVDTESINGAAAASDWLPVSSKDAAEGAAKGKRAKHLSTVEIIERRLSK